MIRKKSTISSTWPFTPEPSPRLEPTVYPLDDIQEDFTMSMSGDEEMPRARPISMAARREGIMSPGRPTLEDVLNNKAPSPYTLAAYTAFLSQQHCLETLEFTTEAKRYAEKYDDVAASLAGMPITVDTHEGWELIQDWTRIMDIYVKPGAPREINLPAEERDDLVDLPCEVRPPRPELLDAAVKRMYDLMSESIFIPFCNSLKQLPYAQTYNTMSEYMHESEPPRLTFDDRTMLHHQPSRRRRSPPNTSAVTFEPSRSPPQQRTSTQSSALSTALSRQSGSRLSTHLSHSSAMSGTSESALTDSSGPDSPPGAEDPAITPPTTPPTSDMGMSGMSHITGTAAVHVAKTQRSESGGWKKAMKIFGGKKKIGSSFEE
ncbi:RGS domain-containing protein [Exophiala viscosa]|uniref:RGS domain-containing protein n=1 Tax=Exophiala viscosa TaxID=2486360 RepID=UPI002190D689|nr:RGS domain-containing protein [Exophiala viscosa]